MLARGVVVSIALVGLLACGSAPPPAAPPAPTVPDDPDAAPPPTATDIAILVRAEALLATASAWNHFGDRTCAAHAQAWNLYCVLERSSIDVTGAFQHRSAAFQEVRWVVDDRTRGIDLHHRLMDYNNLATTTFADIKGVIVEARQRLETKVHAATSARPPAG
jgi:hypothetical protein